MREKVQISHREGLQMTDVDILPSRRWPVTPSPQMFSDLLLKKRGWEEEDLSHMVKVMSAKTSQAESVHPWYDGEKWYVLSGVSLAESHNPNASWRKIQQTQIEGHSTKCLLVLLKTVKGIRKEEILRNCRKSKEAQKTGHLMVKCYPGWDPVSYQRAKDASVDWPPRLFTFS